MRIAALAIVLIAIMLGAKMMCFPGTDVPRFDTPAWAEPGHLLLRREAEGNDVLLLRHLTSDEELRWTRDLGIPNRPGAVIYRYVGGARRLEALGLDAWENATGEVCDCVTDQGIISHPWRRDNKTRALLFKGQELPLRGHLLRSTVSPKGDLVAVQSARGFRGVSPMPFMGGGGRHGPHYHQVFKRSDATPVGKSVVLPFRSGSQRPCFSLDGRYVVYSDTYFNHLSIIDRGLPNGESP